MGIITRNLRPGSRPSSRPVSMNLDAEREGLVDARDREVSHLITELKTLTDQAAQLNTHNLNNFAEILDHLGRLPNMLERLGQLPDMLSLNQEIGRQEQQVSDLQERLETSEHKHEQEQQHHSEIKDELAQLKASVEAKDQQLAQLNDLLQSKDQELKETKQALEAKDQELTDAKQTLGSKDTEFSRLTTMLESKDQEMATLRTTNDMTIRRLFESQTANMEALFERQATTTETLTQHITELKQQIQPQTKPVQLETPLAPVSPSSASWIGLFGKKHSRSRSEVVEKAPRNTEVPVELCT